MFESVPEGEDLAGYVIISAQEYDDLIGDFYFLDQLHEAGVENWEGYADVVNGETATTTLEAVA